MYLQCAFADGAPYLLLGEESVIEFGTHLEKPVSWKNFRPNILVSGGAPFEEVYTVQGCKRIYLSLKVLFVGLLL